MWSLHTKEFTRNRIAFACLFFLLVSGCAVGAWHTSDSKLEKNFILHEAEFEALLAEVNADENLKMLRVDEVRYASGTYSAPGDFSVLEHLGLAKERWVRYNQQLRKLGIVQVTKGEGEGDVEFKVDASSISNGATTKGYWYSHTPPRARRKASLDGYRVSEDDKDQFGDYFVYKPLKGNWYLYLFVNH